MTTEFSFVLARCYNYGVGFRGQLPWPKLRGDMRYFRRLTTGATVIMGSRTWESIPERFRPLPLRKNIVLSTQPASRFTRAHAVARTIFEALNYANRLGRRTFVIGGASTWHSFLQERGGLVAVYDTKIYREFSADTSITWLNPGEMSRKGFKVVDILGAGREHGIPYVIFKWANKRKEDFRSGKNVTCPRCGRGVKASRLDHHQRSYECQAQLYLNKARREEGLYRVGQYHHVLKQSEVTVQRPTSWSEEVFGVPALYFETWAPSWAVQIASLRDSKGLLPSYIRRKMLKMAKENPVARELILDDPETALQILEAQGVRR